MKTTCCNKPFTCEEILSLHSETKSHMIDLESLETLGSPAESFVFFLSAVILKSWLNSARMARLTSRQHLINTTPFPPISWSTTVLKRLHRVWSCNLLLFLAARRAWSAWCSTSDTTNQPTIQSTKQTTNHPINRPSPDPNSGTGQDHMTLISFCGSSLSPPQTTTSPSSWKWTCVSMETGLFWPLHESSGSSNGAYLGGVVFTFWCQKMRNCCCWQLSESLWCEGRRESTNRVTYILRKPWIVSSSICSCWCLWNTHTHTHIKVDTPMLLLYGEFTSFQLLFLFTSRTKNELAPWLFCHRSFWILFFSVLFFSTL